jgi:rubredoxin
VKKYVCNVCGFVYDETVGDPENGVAPGTKWDDLPADWACPMCGATQSDFEQESAGGDAGAHAIPAGAVDEELRELSCGEVSALCSNLSKACAKQYRAEEAGLFEQLAQYYAGKVKPLESEPRLGSLVDLIQQDLGSGYPAASAVAGDRADRGALRALVWGEKVTKILSSLIKRYEKQPSAWFANTNVFVCEICGFVFVGDAPPDVCPVCKVPKDKLARLERSQSHARS